MTNKPEPIRTARLDLLAGDADVLRAELTGRESLEAALGISIPHTWPPELYDADAIEWMLARLDEDSGFEAWGFRYVVLRKFGFELVGDGSEPGVVRFAHSRKSSV